MESSDGEDEDINSKVEGYCHFNDNEKDGHFVVKVFDWEMSLKQQPGDRNMGHGAVVWDAAVVWVKYMETNPKKYGLSALAGRRVVELGSGCGLAGLAFMLKGARVTLTDLSEVTKALTSQNANAVYKRALTSWQGGSTLHEPTVEPIDWTCEYAAPTEGAFDIVLLTDCIFSSVLTPHLIRQIKRLAGKNSEIICCHEIRDVEANDSFLAALAEICTIRRIQQSKLHPEFSSNLINVVIAKPRRKKGGAARAVP
jgi:predicted nicotinamide N-methyase